MSFQKKDLPSLILKERYDSGENMESLAIEFKVTRQTISSHLRAAGTKIRSRRNGKATKPATIARMRELREAGVKYEAIALEIGVSVATVYRHLEPLTNPHRPVLMEMLGQLKTEQMLLAPTRRNAERQREIKARIAALESVV